MMMVPADDTIVSLIVLFGRSLMMLRVIAIIIMHGVD